MPATVKCLVVDDEALARELIETHLAQVPNFEIVASCSSAIEASEVLRNQQVDLMFLDIEMPVLRGVDFYKSLQQRPRVIFTTAYREFALDGFDLEAVDYLLKPITFARFFQAVERYNNLRAIGAELVEKEPTATRSQPDHIFVNKDRKQVKIQLREILYVQSVKDYIQIHMSSGSHLIKQKISAFENQLNNDFTRIHRSYIVNRNHITAYTKHDVEIGDIEIPIGESYRAEFDLLMKDTVGR